MRSDRTRRASGIGWSDGGAKRGIEGTPDLWGSVRAFIAGCGRWLRVGHNSYCSASTASLNRQRNGEVLLSFFQLFRQDIDGVGLQHRQLAVSTPHQVLLFHQAFPLVTVHNHRKGKNIKPGRLYSAVAIRMCGKADIISIMCLYVNLSFKKVKWTLYSIKKENAIVTLQYLYICLG